MTLELETQVNTHAQELGIREAVWQKFRTRLEQLKVHNLRMYEHSLRVGLYATRLASAERRPYARLALFGGCGHDLGKCEIPNELLNASALSPAGFEKVKEHAPRGTAMLKDDFLVTSLIAGLHHAYAPSGYGIDLDEQASTLPATRRQDIEKAAQLVALCDFYDALMTRGNEKGWLRDPGSRSEKAQLLSARFPTESSRVDWLLRNAVVPVGAVDAPQAAQCSSVRATARAPIS